jgi:hypothetical protein
MTNSKEHSVDHPLPQGERKQGWQWLEMASSKEHHVNLRYLLEETYKH